MGLFSFLNKKGDRIKEYKSRGAILVDVRSKEEFNGGHIKGAKNMPLPSLSARLQELEKSAKPVVFCCASGMRSGQATSMAKAKGIDATNGGAWMSLQRHWN